MITGPALDPLHFPSTRYNSHSTATNLEEHREEAGIQQAQRQLLRQVQRETERAIAELPFCTNTAPQQIIEAQINLFEVSSTNTSSAMAGSNNNNNKVTTEITTPPLATTAPTP